ncbi:hypothetical protein [Streptomyces sp. NPDC056660]|uniref:hypothetical protein n=1 Tax=Streptomyces sp. NPDC056660 TaxID=3345897 RepID=UPI0036B9F2D3
MAQAQCAGRIVSYTMREDLDRYLPSLLQATKGLAKRLEETAGTAYPSLSGLDRE